MNPKVEPETDVDDRQFVTRREFGRFEMRVFEKIEDIPKALRTEFSHQVQQSKTPWGTVVTIMLTAGGTLAVVGIALVTALVVYINMRFEIDKGHTSEFHRMQEEAWQQVWKQQNSGMERLENRVDGWDTDMRTRYFDRSDDTPAPKPSSKPHKRKK